MQRRPTDVLKVELLGSAPGAKGVLTNFTSAEIALDLFAPSEASFEMGDDGTWQSGASGSVKPGARYCVTLNGRKMLTGAVHSNDVPVDAPAGAVVRFTIRTKLAEAMYRSADQKIAVKNATLRDFVLAAYAPLGYDEESFIFNADLSRNLRTGKPIKGKSTGIQLAKLTVDEARVSPPEPIFGAVDRHLRRFGLMHWDGPDDTIVIGFPDQGMPPTYVLSARRRSRSGTNNVIGATRSQDYSSSASEVNVYGTSAAKRDFARARISGHAVDPDLIAAGFDRPVNILAEQMLNSTAATNAAWRELSERRQNKDKFITELDGLSYWDGNRLINYAPDTMASYETDVAGGSLGNYYVTRAVLRRDASRGDVAHLTCLKAGILQLFEDAAVGGTAAPSGVVYLGTPEEAPTAGKK